MGDGLSKDPLVQAQTTEKTDQLSARIRFSFIELTAELRNVARKLEDQAMLSGPNSQQISNKVLAKFNYFIKTV
jgi:hypothetical protein